MSVKKLATLLIHCPDQKGIIASVTSFLHHNSGNIVHLDQYVDYASNQFFMRVEWELEDFSIEQDKIEETFREDIAEKFQMTWKMYFSVNKPRMAIFVSKMSHCLYDLIARVQGGEWDIDIPVIISNHDDLRHVAEGFGIEYVHLPITKENKQEQEKEQLRILKEHQIDFIVLARYMQILSADFIDQFPNKIINIHHSFLPAFVGAKPYHSAHERGVKIIGATSHYVTSDLDAGPIIEQDVAHVSHRKTVQDLIREGRDLEKLVLSKAVWYHIQRKLLVYDNKTIVFD